MNDRRPLKRFRNLPLARRLSLIVVSISIATLVIVVYIALISTVIALRDAAQSTLSDRNFGIADSLDRQLDYVPLWMRDTLLPKLVSVYEPGIAVTTVRDALQEVTRLETNLLYQRITVYVPGEPVLIFNFSNPQSGEDMLARSIDPSRIPEDAWFLTAFETGETGWFGPEQDLFSSPAGEVISVVIPFNDPLGQPVGMIWADISPATLLVLLRETIRLEGGEAANNPSSDPGFSFIVGRDERVIASYNARRRTQTELQGLWQRGLTENGITDIDGVFADEQRAFSITHTMGRTDWHLVTVLPDTVLPEIPLERVQQIVLISAAGLLAMVWAVNRFVHVTVAQPASTLGTAAAKIGGGDLAHKIPTDLQEQLDEIGTMARALEDMRSNLASLYNTLEQRVIERTEELNLARQEAQAVAADLRAVYDESLSVVSDYQLQRILKNLVQRIMTLLESQYCGVWLIQPDGEELQLVANTFTDDNMSNAKAKLGEGLSGMVAQHGKPMMLDHYSQFPQRLNLPNLAVIERALCVPMLSTGESIGAILVGRPSDGNSFTDSDQRLLALFANLVSPAVKNAQLFVELEEARVEADRANEVKTRFLASVTHELRTPLNLIINNMDFMRIGSFGDVTEEQSQRLDQTIRSAEHLLYLINDLLDVSKIEAGEMQLFIQPTDLYKVLEDALDSAEMMLDKGDKRTKVSFSTDIEPGIPEIPMDARRVRQVLFNLVSNAIKFTLEGEVALKVSREGNNLHFSVRDTGIGIPEDQHDRLFEAFERTDNAKQLAIEGTGLGLPISRYLVQAHNGVMDFSSNKDKGSTFWFTLPISQEAGERKVTTQMTKIITQKHARIKLDDN